MFRESMLFLPQILWCQYELVLEFRESMLFLPQILRCQYKLVLDLFAYLVCSVISF